MANRVSRRAFLGVASALPLAAACAPPLPPREPTATPPLLKGVEPAPRAPFGPTATPVAGGLPSSLTGDDFVVVAPRVLRPGMTESVSVALFKAGAPHRGDVVLALARTGGQRVEARGTIDGRGSLQLKLPALAEGDYQLEVQTPTAKAAAPVTVEDGTVVLLESDKPIYKPGETIRLRVLTIDGQLRPVAGDVVVDATDAKGIKVFRKAVRTDDLGMASLELPLSTEPNLGTWKVTAARGRRTVQRDVRVERYVLPKYEVKIDLGRDWALAADPIQGTVGAEYSFGKPVKGEVELLASRFVGTWQEYARVNRQLDGKVAFEVPPVRYAAGSPSGGGLASVKLDVTVRETATGYEEKSSRLVTVAATPTVMRVIPEGTVLKPGLPFGLLVAAETPDRKPLDLAVELRAEYLDANFGQLPPEQVRVSVRGGVARAELHPPAGAARALLIASAPNAAAKLELAAGYSPSGSFIRVEPLERGAHKVGETARFRVVATRAAPTFYYEVLARGQVVFSDVVFGNEIGLTVTPQMAPEARLLVYQLLADGEVAADYLPFKVEGALPHAVKADFERAEAKPGDELGLTIEAQGPSRVGLVAIDRAVLFLAENRLNLQQVFDELERLYAKPQVEIHVEGPMGGPVPMPVRPGAPIDVAPAGIVPPGFGAPGNTMPGASELLREAGVVVLTSLKVPTGQAMSPPRLAAAATKPAAAAAPTTAPAAAPPARAAPAAAAAPAVARDAAQSTANGLAEPERVRQYFPETWLWNDLATDQSGRAAVRVTAPDSITTWALRAIALSKEHGLGVAETQLRVFQPFFVQVDLPYAAIRGEELPAKVAIYNYGQDAQEFAVDLDAADWFELVGDSRRTVRVGPNDVGAAVFTIRPRALGVGSLKVTARGSSAADAIVKELIVEPEGVLREVVDNVALAAGANQTLDLTVPAGIVAGSARAHLSLSGSVMAQTIDGLENLLQMPFGCGEQNMLLFAPNVFVARYLKESGQTKPEVMARAERMMLTGYQRELIYRRGEGSFSAFGESDPQGSLWLTAFVLKTFAQAKGLIYVDDAVQKASSEWIRRQQRPDGSFEPVGFVHHQELLGGLKGRTALTAFVAVALLEAGEVAAGGALRFLEAELAREADAYALALSTYALALGKSPRVVDAVGKLMAIAQRDGDALFWGSGGIAPPVPQPPAVLAPGGPGPAPIAPPIPRPGSPALIETTAYAALALLQVRDAANASRALRWLAGKRNAQGGFGSTQDTVVALQAIAAAAAGSRTDVDATLTLSAAGWRKELRVGADNADVVQVLDLPTGGPLQVESRGRGQILLQSVRRFNLPTVPIPAAKEPFEIEVRYGADRVEVNDQIEVRATLRYQPPEPVNAGMVVLDVAVPTGFAHVPESLDALAKREPRLKRWDAAGRKVVLYVEDMHPVDEVVLTFQARALYPVKAQATASQAYAYYRPEWRGEVLVAPPLVGTAVG